MSPTDSGRLANPAATKHPAKFMIRLQPGEERLWVQADDPIKEPPTTDPQPPQPFSSEGARSPQSFRRFPFDDPCTYLG